MLSTGREMGRGLDLLVAGVGDISCGGLEIMTE